MSKPIVAVVGRPNGGKSTLFNRLAGERISIVQDTPGVTRDRIYADCEWLDRKFTLIDTGGMENGSEEIIQRQIIQQAQIAIETADVILFVTDVKTGVTEDDMKVANMLRRTKKPVVLAVNKVDSVKRDTMAIYEFYELGIGDPLPVSAGQALGLGDMLDQVISYFPDKDAAEEEDDAIKVAIIGKPNAGKSSLVNRVTGEERVIVSNVPGTKAYIKMHNFQLVDADFNYTPGSTVNESSAINTDEAIAAKTGKKGIPLKAGKHAITITVVQGPTAPGTFKLEWNRGPVDGHQTPVQPVPAGAYSH